MITEVTTIDETIEVKKVLKNLILSSDGKWKAFIVGDESKIKELLKSHNLRNISIGAINRLVREIASYKENMLSTINAENQLNGAVKMFREGIKVMDHADPTFMGIK